MHIQKFRLNSNHRYVNMIPKILLVSVSALIVAACSRTLESTEQVAGWSILDASQRHPILVSEEPANLSLRVARGSRGLTPHQRARLSDFLARYRGADTGNGKLSIRVPSGSPNEVASLRAVEDAKAVIRDFSIDDSRISVAAYYSDRDAQPPLRIAYTRFIAEAPECGNWPTNLADDSRNLPYPNLGCSTQRNMALQVSNPADLLGPRTMTPAISERRDTQWNKWVGGESTVAKKDQDERASIKGSN
ncbi:MAG: CpaD family pilus assembly protein [Hyphomicrobiaceae bacterium]